jgi:hypothetical protein
VKNAILQPLAAARAMRLLRRFKNARTVFRMNLFDRRCCGQFLRPIAQHLFVGGAVVDTLPVLVDHGDHVRGIFCDELKQLLALRHTAPHTLQLQMLIDRIDIK